MKKLLLISVPFILLFAMIFTSCAKSATAPASLSPTSTSAPASVSTQNSSSTPAQATQTLDIGSVWGLTGPESVSQAVSEKGEELCADWINANGGITVNGQKYNVNIISRDTKSTADGAVNVAQQLVFQNKVKFIVGELVPMDVESVRSITDPNKVLFMASLDDSPSPQFPYTLSATYPYKWPEQALYQYLVQAYPNVKTVAVMNQDEAGNVADGQEAIAEIQKHGLTLGDHLTYPFTATDLLPFVTKVVATKPDAIDFCLAMPDTAAAIVKDARQLGFTGPLICGTGLPPQMLLGQIGPQYANDFFLPSIDPSSPDTQSQIPPMMSQIIKLWNDTYHVPFDLDSVRGWDPLYVLKQAIEKAQSLDPAAVAQAFESMQSVETSFGTAPIGGQQTYGINGVVVDQCPITRLQNGKTEFEGWFTLNIP